MDLNVILLHDKMVNKQGDLVTTSITMIDIHDIARSACTYGVRNIFISHPSPTLRKLAKSLHQHWLTGFGADYNPNRKEALMNLDIVQDLDEAIQKIDLRAKKLPKLIATSARTGPDRTSFTAMTELLAQNQADAEQPYLLMFGTGWGMSEELLQRADYLLDPINGPGPYNHLSVRSACAIILDRLLGRVGSVC